ncbi:MAG: hypothetical protein ABIB04_02380 [Patescibacteria group bacterium]
MSDEPEEDLEEEDYEMEWESAAREAVAALLQSAEWDVEQRCVVLPDTEHGKFPTTVESIEDLRRELLDAFREQWYANAPSEGGDAVFRSDDSEDEVVEEELGKYAPQITSLGWRLYSL